MSDVTKSLASVKGWIDVAVRGLKVAVFTFLSAPIVNAFLEGQAADFNALVAGGRAAIAAGISVVVNAILLWSHSD